MATASEYRQFANATFSFFLQFFWRPFWLRALCEFSSRQREFFSFCVSHPSHSSLHLSPCYLIGNLRRAIMVFLEAIARCKQKSEIERYHGQAQPDGGPFISKKR